MRAPAHAAVEADYPPLMLAQVEALRAYARCHGRTWKAELRTEWMRASAEPLLHRLRNSHGPSWLGRVMLASLPVVSEEQNHAGQC
jgi:hypothetical protein